METNLLDRMLNVYLSSMTPVTITLQNKIRVTGTVKAFDSYVIIMEGPKREIVYRHAVSSLAASGMEESKRKSSFAADKSGRPARNPFQGRPQQQASLSASPPTPSLSETSINNSMKEGLLKWMQEQKAAK
jgi:RNA chaperone Hfq